VPEVRKEAVNRFNHKKTGFVKKYITHDKEIVMSKKSIFTITVTLILVLSITAVAFANTGSAGVVSQPGVTTAYGPLYAYASLDSSDWGPGSPAVATWKHPSWPLISGSNAVWISTADYVEDPTVDSWRKFHDELVLPCTAYNIDASINVAATSDNAEEVYFNGQFIGSDGEVQGPWVDNHEWNTIVNYPVSPQAGANSLDFIVRNYGVAGSTAEGNPTGLIYATSVNFEYPEAIWQPPITNDAFELKDGTTLPIKFKLYTQEGALITTVQNVDLVVYDTSGTEVVAWFLGDGVDNLRFDSYEFYYIANFQTKNYDLVDGAEYTAKVLDECTGDVLGVITFSVSTSNGTGRGNK
jgi:hypothetical protein